MSSLTRALYSPTPSMNQFTTPVPVAKGGTGGMDAVQAVENLGGIPLSKANVANGWPALDASLVLPESVFPIESQGGPTIRGPLTSLINEMNVYTITNYDSEHAYTLIATTGFVSRDGDTIYYRAPSSEGVAGFELDSKAFPVTIYALACTQPTIIRPADTTARLAATPLQDILVASDRASGDRYGIGNFALSADGQTLAVGAYFKDVSGIIDAGQVYVYVRSGDNWVQQSIITASDKVTGDNFGVSVALTADGSRLAIGAHSKEVSAITDAGQVYIYIRSGNTWVLESTLSAGDKATSDTFGVAVSFDAAGTRLAVGAHGKDPSAITNAGQAYVYTRTGTIWTQEAIITAGDKSANDYFGLSVSLNSDGSRLAVGAYGKTVSSVTGAGKTYVYTRSITTWTEHSTVTAYDKAANDWFGTMVALSSSGTRLFVSAQGKDISGVIDTGKVYVYVLVDNTWVLELELTSPSLRYSEYFGSGIAVCDTVLCIGAIFSDSEDVANCGVVYTYDLSYESTSIVRQRSIIDFTSSAFNTDGYRVIDALEAADGVLSDQYGNAVAVSADGQYLVVGADGRTVGGLTQAGQVYVYGRTGSTWTLLTTLSPSDKAAADRFGASTAISANGDRIIIGAYNKTISGVISAGQIYTFIRSGTTWIQESVLSAPDRATGDQFGIAVSIDASGTRLAIGARNKTVSATTAAGKVYIYLRSGAIWLPETTLNATSLAVNDSFGSSVAFNSDASLLAVGVAGRLVSGITTAGAVTLYSRTGTVWSEGVTLTASDKAVNDGFGTYCAFSTAGNKLAISAAYKDMNGGVDSGQIYIFRYINSAWVEDAKITDSANESGQLFGHRMCFNGDGSQLFVGAPWHDSSLGIANTGIVYTIALSEHEGTDWQLSTDPGFLTVVQSVTNSYTYRTTWQVNGLSEATDYYVRCRHKSTTLGYSDWSPVIKLTTRDQYLPSIEIGTLTAYDRAANDQFGCTVSLSTDGLRLAVGANLKTVSSVVGAGKVYVYTRSGSTWILEAEITASDRATNDYFGVAVCLDGTGSRLAIGAHGKDVSSADNGKVYIYTRSGSVWTEETTIVAADRAVNDYFGAGLCLDSAGSRIAIGAFGKDVSGTVDAGQVYIYTRAGSIWTLESTITAYDKVASDYFGISMTFDDGCSRIAIGAFNKAVGGVAGAGKVYVFVRAGTTWTLEAELSASDKATSDNFGTEVALDDTGTRLIVGANGKDVSGLTDAGKIYTYTRVGSVWTEVLTITASDKAATDQFGAAISLANDASLMAVGAYSRDVSGLTNAGQVYLFK